LLTTLKYLLIFAERAGMEKIQSFSMLLIGLEDLTRKHISKNVELRR